MSEYRKNVGASPQPAVDAQEGGDERARFEAWAAQRFPAKCLSSQSDSMEMDEAREFAREGWQAALSSAPVAASVGKPVALPYPIDLTDDLREVLGWPNFRCGPVAHLMRAAGADIKRKAEDEQAVVLHWLVTLVLTHGSEWRTVARDEMTAMQERVKAAPKNESPLKRCAAARDGDCDHAQCPQLRDGEPEKSGRHCPLDISGDDE